jgi:phosphohistidine phosphatase
MRHLIIMRHAKAERNAPSGRDFDRGLTDRGRTDAALIARELARSGLSIDLALVSASARTAQTWAAMADAFPGARLQTERSLYNATSQELQQAISLSAPGAETLVVIAHNPGIQALSEQMLRQASAPPSIIERASSRFPTATAAVFAIDAADRATYDDLFYAADHGGGGGE